MDNFSYQAPTEIYFGQGQIEQLTTLLTRYGQRVLLTYGGGSIKKIGLYDDVIARLQYGGFFVIELAGIEPNPRIETVEKGIALCREHQIDVILAVGGGSTIDCSKVIAAGTHHPGPAWDIVEDSSLIVDALPLVTILTLAATGSEMNGGGVISNLAIHAKKGTKHPAMLPKASILDPAYTYSVSKYQTASGVADIMSHTFENYFKATVGADIQDRMCEAILKTCIQYGPIALEEPSNYTARANLMWCSSLALNGLLGSGKQGSWSNHPIEHQLSAFYDITHGIGLAIITPRWMQYIVSEQTMDKFVAYGINVWNIDSLLEPATIASLAIEKTASFFYDTLAIPRTLHDVGIADQQHFTAMAKQAVAGGLANAYVPLQEHDVIAILQASF